MIEVEVKLPLSQGGTDTIVQQLLDQGFELTAKLLEEDRYFDRQDETIRRNGQALRIRQVTDLLADTQEAMITWKGSKLDQVSMTRKELETGIGSAAVGEALLEELGYLRVDPVVKKYRCEYRKNELCICVDRVDGLGDFLELEVVLPDGEAHEKALGMIREMLTGLGYSMEDTTRVSYLGLLMKKRDSAYEEA